ncbi:MAG: hypothetical protein WA883_07750 [Phormidesmis sp.]
MVFPIYLQQLVTMASPGQIMQLTPFERAKQRSSLEICPSFNRSLLAKAVTGTAN